VYVFSEIEDKSLIFVHFYLNLQGEVSQIKPVEVVVLSGSESDGESENSSRPSTFCGDQEVARSTENAKIVIDSEIDDQPSTSKRVKFEYVRNPETENSQKAELEELLKKEAAAKDRDEEPETQAVEWDED